MRPNGQRRWTQRHRVWVTLRLQKRRRRAVITAATPLQTEDGDWLLTEDGRALTTKGNG